MTKKGFILLAVLWIMVFVGLIGLGLHNTSLLEAKITNNIVEQTRAQAMADSGIEMAVAILREDELTNEHDSLKDTWADSSASFEDIGVSDKGFFSVYKDNFKNDGTMTYGLTDEESKINVNTADEEMLSALPEMTDAMVDALLDWRDDDDNQRNLGAEKAYYETLPDPYLPRNGPFETLEELLLVKGFNREFVYGEDTNRNGILDAAEDDAAANYPPDNQNGRLDRGILSYITLWSYDKNVDGDGNSRVNINTADEKALTDRLKDVLDESEIKAIVKFREERNKQPNRAGNKESNGHKHERGAEKESGGDESKKSNREDSNEDKENEGSGQDKGSAQNQAGNGQDKGSPQNQAGGGQENRVVFNSTADVMEASVKKEKFIEISDKITTTDTEVFAGKVNVNTAPKEVLQCVFPKEKRPLADKIVSYREEKGAFKKIGEILNVSDIDVALFKQIEPYLCVRSNVFTVRSVGYRTKSKAMAMTEAVIDRGPSPHEIRYWRNIR